MGFIRQAIERREFSLERWVNYLDGAGGRMSEAGVAVSTSSALTWAIVWGCILVKSQDMAKVPLPLYRRLGKNGEEGREEATDDPIWALLRSAPNKYMSPFIFRQTLQVSKETQGNGWAVIERDGRGNATALWPRDPDYFTPRVLDGRLVYEYASMGSGTRFLEAYDVFHIKGMSLNGYTGLSPINAFREGIGVGLGYQKHNANTFRNSARPSLVASQTNPAINLSYEKAQEIAKSLAAQYSGQSNAGKIMVSYGGLELKQWGFSNKDAEYIESARLSNEDACRIWRMPPYKVMDYTQSAYANMATASEEYVNDTLRPDQVGWEEEAAAKLLSESKRRTMYFEHNNDSLLKGTPKERSEVENLRLLNGTSNINEVRRSHNWNPVAGGDRNRMQMQMVPIDAPPAESATPPPAV
jgi:HK97 family phage portal protein